MAKQPHPTDPMIVTFRPDPNSEYGTVECSWEDQAFRREHPRDHTTETAARKVAEGFSAEFRMEAVW